jgi:hypothetical protein
MTLRLAALTITTLVMAAAVAVLPSAASATLSPAVTLSEPAGSLAGSTGSLGVAIAFNQSSGDAVKNLTLSLPPGLLINDETAGGACLPATGPLPPCQLASGTAVIAGANTPMSLYLVRPPVPTDLAGIQLVAGPVSVVGGLTFRSSSDLGISPSLFVGDQIAFTDLPASPISSLTFTLTGLTLPSSCSSADVAVWASSQQRQYPAHARAPYEVTGCAGIEYLPTATEKIARDAHSTRGAFVIELISPPGDAASQSVKVQVPANLALNPQLSPCLQGTKCTVGTVAATSPILPAGQLTGTMFLSGTERAPALAIAFPPPLGLQLSSSWTSTGLTLYTLPDLPLTSLTLSFTGNSLGRMFVIQCYPNSFAATFTPKTGLAPVQVNEPLTEAGCRPAHHAKLEQGPPTASATLSGLASGAPRLSLKVAKGKRSPGIRSLTVTLPSGLSFVAGALGSSRALSLSGAKLASARIRQGALVVTFKRSSAKSSLSLGGALVVESSSLIHEVRSHHAHMGRMTVRVTDARGRHTRLKLAVKVS